MSAVPENESANELLPLGRKLSSYVTILAEEAPSVPIFRTGAGRIFRDLLLHWPLLDGWEGEAQDICNRITEAVFPLARETFSQAVEFNITISRKPIAPPDHVEAMSTFVLFDGQEGVERHFFLSPSAPLPPDDILTAAFGIAVLCRPLNYRYHTIKDDRKRVGHPHAGIFELPQRLINEMYEEPNFVPREKIILETLKTKIQELPKQLKSYAVTRQAVLSIEPRHVSPSVPLIAGVTSLSALPPPVRALERRVMDYVVDHSLSPALRLGLRQIAQTLRGLYPQALIEEAALRETARPVSSPSPTPNVRSTAAYVAPFMAPRREAREQMVFSPTTRPEPRYAATSSPLSVRPTILVPSTSRIERQPLFPPAPVVTPPAMLMRPSVTGGLRPQPPLPSAPHAELPRPTGGTQQNRPQTEPRVEPRPSIQQDRSPQPEVKPAAASRTEQPRPTTATQPTPQAETRATPQPAGQTQAPRQPEPRPTATPTEAIRPTAARQARPQIEARTTHDSAPAPQNHPQGNLELPTPAPRPSLQPEPTTTKASFTPPQPFRTPKPMPLFHHAADMDTRPLRFYAKLAPLPSPVVFPKAIPQPSVGRLDKVASPRLTLRSLLLSGFPTPGPAPMPNAALFKGKK